MHYKLKHNSRSRRNALETGAEGRTLRMIISNEIKNWVKFHNNALETDAQFYVTVICNKLGKILYNRASLWDGYMK